MMYQYRFMNCNKCTTLLGMLIMGEAMVGSGGIWEISVSSSQFCCEPKIALKKSLLKNREH